MTDDRLHSAAGDAHPCLLRRVADFLYKNRKVIMKYIIIAIFTAVITPIVLAVRQEPTVDAVADPVGVSVAETIMPVLQTTAQEAVDSTQIDETIVDSSATETEPEPAEIQATQSYSGTKYDWLAAAGVPESDWNAADILVTKESSWNPAAINSSSGACGLAQALPCSKLGENWNDPVHALAWMDTYVRNRYGGWQQALNFHYANNWY